MCKRRDAIAVQNAAAQALTRACNARRNYVEIRGDLLRDGATVKHLPAQPADFDLLLDQLDRKTRGRNASH